MIKQFISFIISFFIFSTFSSNIFASADILRGKEKYKVCASCHGANGEGNKDLNAPKLSGMQDWYIARQLQHFKKGIRGANPKDTYGMQMAPMAMTLPDNKAIENIAAYISTLR